MIPSDAAYTKNSPSATVALIRLIAALIPITIPSCTMNRMKKLPAANAESWSFDCTNAATPAVTSSPANIQTKAWVRNAVCRRASGLTPSVDGDAY